MNSAEKVLLVTVSSKCISEHTQVCIVFLIFKLFVFTYTGAQIKDIRIFSGEKYVIVNFSGKDISFTAFSQHTQGWIFYIPRKGNIFI